MTLLRWSNVAFPIYLIFFFFFSETRSYNATQADLDFTPILPSQPTEGWGGFSFLSRLRGIE